MRKLLLIKSAPEIFIKGLNRHKFEKKLMSNIENSIYDIKYELVTDMNRWFLYSDDMDKLMERLLKVFGISEICIVSEISKDYESIKKEALEAVKESGKKTFKVETNRADKSFPYKSLDVNKDVGAYILENSPELKVDVHNPECIVYVEIREKNAYVYSKKIKAQGGMPYETNGSTFLMLSGGIDSPVAGYMMARRGVKLNCVYYHSAPYTSERAKEKVKALAKILKSYTGEIKLYVVPFTKIQMDIIEKCREDELTIIMRRFMMRIACRLSEKLGVQSVSTGESIGQVASQTMESLVVSDEVSDRPVFRPLISFDKIDIVDIAEKIGTYETSILPYEDCCTIFVPKHPKTKPVLNNIINSEKVLDIEGLVNEAIEGTEVIDI